MTNGVVVPDGQEILIDVQVNKDADEVSSDALVEKLLNGDEHIYQSLEDPDGDSDSDSNVEHHPLADDTFENKMDITSKENLKEGASVEIVHDGAVVGKAVIFRVHGICHGDQLSDSEIALVNFAWFEDVPDFALPIQGMLKERSDLDGNTIWPYPLKFLRSHE